MKSALLKRGLDLVLVLGTAPVWGPLLLVLALLVRWKMGPGVLFRQPRPGRDEVLFEILKFRTMTQTRDGQGNLLPDEARVTPFGLWLRATSLDELPELLNVLKGEMSLVGPRPLLVQYLPRYSPDQRRRHAVAPGLTGWAQIHGRNALDWPERFQLDVWYVEHQSLGLDLKILARTLKAVVLRQGINAEGRVGMEEFQGTARSDP